jgi:hypothetical protein
MYIEFWLKALKELDLFEDTGVIENVILKWILKK